MIRGELYISAHCARGMKVVQCAIYIVFGKTNTLQFKKILLTKQVGNTKNENTSEIPVERTKTKV